MPANYDKIAGVYDFLSRMVFGGQIVKAQLCLLHFIPAGSRVLIVGGGTGWILEQITRQQASGISIDYVEASAQMIRISKNRNYGTNNVNFIQLPIEDFTTTGLYDVILTPFLFDNFKSDKIEVIFKQLHALLKTNGYWLHVDFFYNENRGCLWQKLLLKLMYFFFGLICNVEANELVNMEEYFATAYQKKMEQAFYFGFIKSTAYLKTSSTYSKS